MEKQTYKKPKTQTAKRSVPTRKRLSESESDNTCVVCALPLTIYAVSQCDHYICFKCSTKIRLLCEENLCPVCRKESAKVIFTKVKKLFKEMNSLKLIKDTDYDVGIYFADISIIKDYRHILEHRCPICPNRSADKTFEQTKLHLRKEHTMFYCEICLEHNRTFTSECKVYSRKDLATHKRIGDPDDSSHRGHPLCVYCDVRFLDEDKLFHHLRTTHFYCHICDQGDSNEFYATYNDLREHFRGQHFLCEEGDCINEEFTSVFGSKLDYKAHCASVHRDTRSKQQLKKERQLDLGFQYSSREVSSSRGRGQGRGAGRGTGRGRQPRNRPRHDQPDYSNAFEREGDVGNIKLIADKEKESLKSNPVSKFEEIQISEDRPTVFFQDDFPDLSKENQSNAVEEPPSLSTPSEDKKENLPLWSKDASVVTSRFETEEDFPSLPIHQAAASSSATLSWNMKKTKTSKKSNKSAIPTSRDVQAYNSTSGSSKPTKSASKSFNKNFQNEEDFPQLSRKSAVPTSHNDAQVFKSSSGSSKPSKSASRSFNKNFQNDEDFPQLSTLGAASATILSAPIGKALGSKPATNASKSKANNVPKKKGNQTEKNIPPKANASKGKKMKTAPKKTDDEEFPEVSSINQVQVGRGSSKHLEMFESFSDNNITPNVAIVSSEAIKNQVEKPNEKGSEFTPSQNDFPSMPTFNTLSAPPGFNAIPKLFNSNGSFTGSSSLKNISKQQTSSTVKPPPGFTNISVATENMLQASSSIPKAELNTFPSGDSDFPSLSSIYKFRDSNFLFDSTEEPNSANGTDISSADKGAVSKPASKPKTNSHSKKKSKQFQSRDSDFPSLTPHNSSSQTMLTNNEPPTGPSVRKPIAKVPSGTDLNLANVFDFPSL